ncbi:MAG TPA: hypothetical protein VEK73_07120 [Xanthobacteraceae bacterium]|nr:hypothetical protein [Xanthobacteraceae bacterium]
MKRIRSKLAMAAALVATVLAFSAVPQPAAARHACPFVLYKACVLTPAGTRETVATNKCFAHARHWTILHIGPCVGPICNMLWMPVCAQPPYMPTPRTFSSLCWAEVDNAVFLYNGVCH